MKFCFAIITVFMLSVLSGCGTIGGTIQGLGNDLKDVMSIGYELL